MRNYMAVMAIAFTLSASVSFAEGRKDDVGFELRVFGGTIYIPLKMTMETIAIKEGVAKFSNLYAIPKRNGASKRIIVSVGVIGPEQKSVIAESEKRTECYGFKQSFLTIDSGNEKTFVVYFYDDDVYVEVLSDDDFFWEELIDGFAKNAGDIHFECVKDLTSEQ